MKIISFILILIGNSFILSIPINKINEKNNLKNLTIPKTEVINLLNVSEVEKIEGNLRIKKLRRLGLFSDIYSWFSNRVDDVKNFASSAKDTVNTYIVGPVIVAADTVKDYVKTEVVPEMSTALNFAKTEITMGMDKIKNGINDKIVGPVITVTNNAKNYVENNVIPAITNTYDYVKNGISTGVDTVKNKYEEIKEDVSETIETAWDGMMDSIYNVFKSD